MMGAPLLIDTTEVYVVQSRLSESDSWNDEREFIDEGEAFDWRDYLKEDGQTLARVVRRWR